MQSIQPAGAWAFLALGAIVALYMFRRRHVDVVTPSTLLWRRAHADRSAVRPLQKVRRSLLLILRLLLAAVMALALMRVALPGASGETVLIFDLSASMRAEGRMDAARGGARELLSGLAPGDRVTILAAEAGGARQLLTRSADRQAARDALSRLEPGLSGADIPSALSLARAMNEELGAVNTYVFSDDYVPGEGVSAFNAPRGADNRALLTLSVNAAKALLRVANYGPACAVTAELYADGALCDARALTLGAGEVASVTFDAPEDVPSLVARIAGGDAVPDDDEIAWKRPAPGRVVALSGESVFLESALALGGTRLIKAEDAALDALDADVYVRAGDGLIVFYNQSGGGQVEAGEERAPTAGVRAASGRAAMELTKYMTLEGVALRSFRPLAGGEPVLVVGGDALVAAYDGAVAFGFEPGGSNLPLKADYPVLVRAVIDRLAPAVAAEAEAERMDPRESDVRFVAPTVYAASAANAARPGAGELTRWLAALALCLALAEWWVMRRGV